MIKKNKRLVHVIVGMVIALLIIFIGVSFINAQSVTITGNDFISIQIREGSAEGEIVADLKNNVKDALMLTTEKEYYLCITAQNPKSETQDGFLKVTFGDEISSGLIANGLYYYNVPGSTYNVGAINDDSFDSIINRVDAEEISYGTENKQFTLLDGSITYKIKRSKDVENPVNMALGFKVSSKYFTNVSDVKDAIKVSMGLLNEREEIASTTSTLSSDITLDNAKRFALALTLTNGSIAPDKSASSSVSFQSATSSAILYDQFQFDITYDANAVISFSNRDSMQNGEMKVGTAIDNKDGTYTNTVTFCNGYKSTTTLYGLNYTISFPSKYYKIGDTSVVKISNASYTPRNGVKTNLSIASATDTYTMIDAEIDGTALSAGGRVTDAAGKGNVYNWNLGREELLETTSLLTFANVANKNTTNATDEEKTLSIIYNTNNALANINMITVPVGLDTEAVRTSDKKGVKNNFSVSWTGFDENGNVVSGVADFSKTDYVSASSSYYVIMKAKDYGIVSFKSITADIGRLWKSYTTSTYNGNYNTVESKSCAAYGYFTSQDIGEIVTSSYELYNTDPDAPADYLSSTGRAESTNDPRCVYVNDVTKSLTDEEGKENSSKIVAGSSVILYANKSVLAPHKRVYSSSSSSNVGSNTTLIVNPIVFLKLPKGMTYSDLSFRLNTYPLIGSSYTKDLVEGADFTVENISYKNTTDDGVTIYRIQFIDKNMSLGYYDANGNANTLGINIEFHTGKSMTTTTYDFNDLINLSSEVYSSVSGFGSDSNVSSGIEDIYNINGGKTLASGRIHTSTIKGITVQSLSELTIDNAVAITVDDSGNPVPQEDQNWITYDTSNSNSIGFMGLSSEADYRIQLHSPSTGVDDFRLFIPIPNQKNNDSLLMKKNEYAMNMVPESIPDGYQMTYVNVTSQESKDSSELTYEVCDQDAANTILITADHIKGNQNAQFIFHLTLKEGKILDAGSQVLFSNVYDYIRSGSIETYVGGKIATEIATSKIKGCIFLDNGDGIQTSDEPGVADVIVTAKDTQGRILSTRTDANGNYLLTTVRNDDIKMNYEVISSDKYRFNVPVPQYVPENGVYSMISPAKNTLNAIYNVSDAGDEVTVNGAVRNIYSLTYQKGTGGSGQVPQKQEYKAYTEATVGKKPEGLYRTGYEFIGWGLNAKDTVATYQAGDTFIINNDTVLYALWQPKKINITFDYQNGIPADPSFNGKNVLYGQTYETADELGRKWPAVTAPEGYQFWKWEIADQNNIGHGTQITNSSKVAITDDVTLRAVFTKLDTASEKIEITYGDHITDDQPLINLNNINIIHDAKPEAAKPITYKCDAVLPNGLTFNADKSCIYGDALEVFDGEIVIQIKGRNGLTYDYHVSLKVNPIDVQINLRTTPQGGLMLSNPTENVALEISISNLKEGIALGDSPKVEFYISDEDAIETKIGSVDIIDGNAAVQWTVSKSGSYRITAEPVDISSAYRINGTMQLSDYIVSDLPVYLHEVTFDRVEESATLSEDMKVVTEGKLYQALPEPVCKGKIFDGWFTEKDGGIRITESTLVKLGEDNSSQILYAHWTNKQYVVNFDGVTLEKMTVNYCQDQLIPHNNPIQAGRTFINWTYKDRPITSNTKYSDLVPDSINEITIKANWKNLSYRVNYDYNGGTGDALMKLVTYGDPFGTLVRPSRVGYEFEGWKLGDTIVTDSTIYLTPDHATLVAQWKEKGQYRVTYNADNGSEQTEVTGVTWMQQNLIPAGEVQKKGYSLLGWYANVNGKEVLVTGKMAYAELVMSDETKSVNLTAKWTQNKYQLTFDAFGGNVSVPTKEIVYDGYYGNLPIPVKNGYTFEGWFLEDVEITATTKVTESENHILYAKWKIIEYTITYELHGGVLEHENPSVYNVESPSFTLYQPSLDRKVFLGWVTKAAGINRPQLFYQIDKGTYGNLHFEAVFENLVLNLNLNPADVDFGEVHEEYVNINPQKIRITNTGNDKITLERPLEESINTNYYISEYEKSELDPGDSTTFTIQPKIGLMAGNYDQKFTFVIEDDFSTELQVKFEVKEPLHPGTITVDTNINPYLPAPDIINGIENLKDAVFTGEEIEQINHGLAVKLLINIKELGDEVTAEDKKLINEILTGEKVYKYLDITFIKEFNNGVKQPVTSTKHSIKFSAKMPEHLLIHDETKQRIYYMVRVHDGKAEMLDCHYDKETGNFTFETDKFSTYAMVYQDIELPQDSVEEPGTDNEPETKPDTNPEVKPDVTPDTKPETTPETGPEATPEVKPEATPDMKPESTPDMKPGVNTDLRPDGSVDGNTNVQTEAGTDVATEFTENHGTVPYVEPITESDIKPVQESEQNNDERENVSEELNDVNNAINSEHNIIRGKTILIIACVLFSITIGFISSKLLLQKYIKNKFKDETDK